MNETPFIHKAECFHSLNEYNIFSLASLQMKETFQTAVPQRLGRAVMGFRVLGQRNPWCCLCLPIYLGLCGLPSLMGACQHPARWIGTKAMRTLERRVQWLGDDWPWRSLREPKNKIAHRSPLSAIALFGQIQKSAVQEWNRWSHRDAGRHRLLPGQEAWHAHSHRSSWWTDLDRLGRSKVEMYRNHECWLEDHPSSREIHS